MLKNNEIEMSVNNTKSEQWDEVYLNGDTTWDVDKPETSIVSLVNDKTLVPCKTLDVGCGTGNEAVFLAKKGFMVWGIDISNLAINHAKTKAIKANVGCHFYNADALELSFLKIKFDLIIDKACFHFIKPEHRSKYVNNIKNLLTPYGKFLLIVASEYDRNINGPYKFSENTIRSIFGKDFNILQIKPIVLINHKLKPMPYLCLMKNKLDLH